MRGESELRTMRSRSQRLHRQYTDFAECEAIMLSMDAPLGNPRASRARCLVGLQLVRVVGADLLHLR